MINNQIEIETAQLFVVEQIEKVKLFVQFEFTANIRVYVCVYKL